MMAACRVEGNLHFEIREGRALVWCTMVAGERAMRMLFACHVLGLYQNAASTMHFHRAIFLRD